MLNKLRILKRLRGLESRLWNLEARVDKYLARIVSLEKQTEETDRRLMRYTDHVLGVIRMQGMEKSWTQDEFRGNYTDYPKLAKGFYKLLEHLGLEVCDGGEVKKKGRGKK